MENLKQQLRRSEEKHGKDDLFVKQLRRQIEAESREPDDLRLQYMSRPVVIDRDDA